MSAPPRSPATPPPFGLVGMVGLIENGHRAPPNSPNSLSSSPVVFRRDRQATTGTPIISYDVDLRGVSYIDEVDENLMCPICHCALIEPVTTDCDHTFCQECIHKALDTDENCPMDRSDLTAEGLVRSPKIVFNQLDNLKIKCPYCDSTVPRSMITHHLEKYCLEALIQCPGASNPEQACEETVKRKFKEKGCLHYLTTCPDCQGILMQVEMDDHQEKTCKERNTKCELCTEEILRCNQDEHAKECSHKVVGCKYKGYGCDHMAKRADQQSHLNNDCNFRTIGPITDILTDQLGTLSSELRTLIEKNEYQERRIKFLERGPDHSDRYMDFPNELQSHLAPGPSTALIATHFANPDSGNEYMLSLIEEQANRQQRLATDLSNLDTKHTQMLYNETLPIKNEMNEMRSTLQMNSVHLRWLMRFRIQENQRRSGVSGGGGPTGPGQSSDGGSSLPRRLSDSRERL